MQVESDVSVLLLVASVSYLFRATSISHNPSCTQSVQTYLFTSDPADNVELYVITKPFVGGANFKQYMHHWAKRALKKKDAEFNASLFPRIYVIHQHINDSELPRYFKVTLRQHLTFH